MSSAAHQLKQGAEDRERERKEEHFKVYEVEDKRGDIKRETEMSK